MSSTTTVVVTAQYLEPEDVSSDNDTVTAFSGVHTVLLEEQEDPEVIWDSGSTITLAKSKIC